MRPCCITHRAHARFIPPCLFPSVQVKVHDIATFNHHNFAFHAARAPSESLKQLAFAFNLQRRMYFLHCTNLQLQRVPAVSQKKSPFRDLVIFTQPLSPDIPLSLKLSDGRWSSLPKIYLKSCRTGNRIQRHKHQYKLSQHSKGLSTWEIGCGPSAQILELKEANHVDKKHGSTPSNPNKTQQQRLAFRCTAGRQVSNFWPTETLRVMMWSAGWEIRDPPQWRPVVPVVIAVWHVSRRVKCLIAAPTVVEANYFAI